MGPVSFALAGKRCEELVAETLVVPFCVIVHYVFGYRCAQVSLTERYEAVETLSTYGGERIFPRMRSDLDYWGACVRIPGHRERRFQPKVNIHSKAS